MDNCKRIVAAALATGIRTCCSWRSQVVDSIHFLILAVPVVAGTEQPAARVKRNKGRPRWQGILKICLAAAAVRPLAT